MPELAVPLLLEDDEEEDAVGAVVVTETICPWALRTVVTVEPSVSLVTVVVSLEEELEEVPPLDAAVLDVEVLDVAVLDVAVLEVEVALALAPDKAAVLMLEMALIFMEVFLC